MMGEKSHGVIIVENHLHTKETCWKLHGTPTNWKQTSKCDGRAYQITIEETHEPSTNSDAIPFTKEQLEHLYK